MFRESTETVPQLRSGGRARDLAPRFWGHAIIQREIDAVAQRLGPGRKPLALALDQGVQGIDHDPPHAGKLAPLPDRAADRPASGP